MPKEQLYLMDEPFFLVPYEDIKAAKYDTDPEFADVTISTDSSFRFYELAGQGARLIPRSLIKRVILKQKEQEENEKHKQQ